MLPRSPIYLRPRNHQNRKFSAPDNCLFERQVERINQRYGSDKVRTRSEYTDTEGLIAKVQITECSEEVASWLEEKLLLSLGDTNEQGENSSMRLAATKSEDQIIGGLVASTAYGWLLVKILWVDSRWRGSGIGSSLMRHAEGVAVARGCHGVWLDTSSSDAYKFYLSLGFEVFGELQNNKGHTPVGHQRWFMKKLLEP